MTSDFLLLRKEKSSGLWRTHQACTENRALTCLFSKNSLSLVCTLIKILSGSSSKSILDTSYFNLSYSIRMLISQCCHFDVVCFFVPSLVYMYLDRCADVFIHIFTNQRICVLPFGIALIGRLFLYMWFMVKLYLYLAL